MKEIKVISSLDGSEESNLFFYPESGTDVPLVVGLHTWSFDRFNQVDNLLPLCRERGWALLLPEFRGPNVVKNPRAFQACGSKPAMQDIIDAVESVTAEYSIDRDNIFLMGGSGGGHMSLMTGAYRPELWRGVSSWCPITDVAAWHGQNPNYSAHMEACCGGKPGQSQEVDRQYHERSPMSYLNELKKVNLSVHHGRYDSSVPYTHTRNLAYALEALGAGSFFFEILDGGHDFYPDVAFKWFDKLYSKQKAAGLTG